MRPQQPTAILMPLKFSHVDERNVLNATYN